MHSESGKVSFLKQDLTAIFALVCYILFLFVITNSWALVSSVADSFSHANFPTFVDVATACDRSFVANFAKEREPYCPSSERTAGAFLKQHWNEFKATDRAACIAELVGSNPSYTELLTCLDIKTH